ncbi:uncharacterized protein [Branchiostoma lanceolatum]|uniref:uncharacterized protein n=1 Tax=Branchiostoma lanceolatum TaxID=7740 RepID=UPI00345194A9
MPNVAATHRNPLQVDGGATKHQSRAQQSQKINVAYPRQHESNRAPAEQEHGQDRSTIPREEASPTVRQGDNGDSPTSQSSFPAVLQEPDGSSHKRESISQTRESSLPLKLRQFILPGMRKQNNRDTYVTSRATSQMPFEAIDSYHREEESGRKHLRTSKDIVASFGRQDETHLQGLSGTKVDSNLPCSRNTENCEENSHERMTSDITNSNPKEPGTVDENASGSVLSSVFHEAPIYKRLEEHRSRPSMNLQSSSMPPEPIGYAERQLQRSDTSSVPRPLIPSYHGQGGRSSTEAHMEPVLSELTPSAERQLNHQTAQLCESSVAFPYRRRNGESSVTQPHDGPPSTVSTSLETLPGFQKLVQINGSTVWVPRTFDTISPLTYPPVHVNPGDTAHAHQSSPSSHQVENIEKHPQGEPVPMESHEAMPARHQVDNNRVNPRESQTSEEQYAYQEQPPDFLTQGELSIVIKKEPLSPLSDSVNEEERELIQGVLSGASLTESLEQQMLNSGDAPRGTEGENLERPPGSEHETGADEGSSSATSEISDGSRKWRKLYHCPLCSYFTRHRGNVKQHVRVHTRERPFKCPMCDYTGARKEHVQVHMKRHTGERPFKCDHCEYRTSRKPDLVKHLRTHSGDRPYACPKCAYRAAVQSALVNHLRTHTGEKPYKCHFCNHSTARRRELFKHMGRHSEEERNYAVELYGKR